MTMDQSANVLMQWWGYSLIFVGVVVLFMATFRPPGTSAPYGEETWIIQVFAFSLGCMGAVIALHYRKRQPGRYH